jgi:hypothetical protein
MGRLLARYVGPGYAYGIEEMDNADNNKALFMCKVPAGTIKEKTKYTIICRFKFVSDGEAGAYSLISLDVPNNDLLLYGPSISTEHNYVDGSTVTGITSIVTNHWRESYVNMEFNVVGVVVRHDHKNTETTPELTVYWCELWEGDNEFSLKDAIDISDKPDADDFQEIIDACTNKNYFSDANPIRNLISWIGYTKL